MYRLIVILLVYTTKVASTASRIVGGSDTQIEKYPYQVSVRKAGRHICGGSVIKSDAIISAAHCFTNISVLGVVEMNFDFLFYDIMYGSSNISSNENIINVSRINVHPKYNSNTNDYDIAVIRLLGNIEFNTRVQPIPIGTGRPPIGSSSIITGWGTTSEGGSTSETLQVAEVFTISQLDCQKSYDPRGVDITDQMICAGLPEGGVDSCQGDSGGPMAIEGKLYGVVSFGIGCARQEYPGVYALITEMEEFVTDNIK